MGSRSIGVIFGIATASVAGPAIAASIGAGGIIGTTAGGTIIARLESAALSSASLADLGGVSVAAGMAGGACVDAGWCNCRCNYSRWGYDCEINEKLILARGNHN